jgi:hypothetical protein
MNDLLNKEIELQDKFQMSTSDSKFAEFFRKIYNKKYKLPRVQSADDGKSFKQAVTADILYSSTHGCCQGFFLGVELTICWKMYISGFMNISMDPLEVCHKDDLDPLV